MSRAMETIFEAHLISPALKEEGSASGRAGGQTGTRILPGAILLALGLHMALAVGLFTLGRWWMEPSSGAFPEDRVIVQLVDPAPVEEPAVVRPEVVEQRISVDRPAAQGKKPGKTRPLPAPSPLLSAVEKDNASGMTPLQDDWLTRPDAVADPIALPAAAISADSGQERDAGEKNTERDGQGPGGGAAGALQNAAPLYSINPPPQYPKTARQRGYQGTALLEVLVDRLGRPAELRILSSSGYQLLDQAALAAVRGWSFSPALQGAEPIDMWVRVPISFKLQ